MLEATRPIGIVHVQEEDRAVNETTTPAAGVCRQNTSVSLYLPRRLHSNPPRTGIGAVSLVSFSLSLSLSLSFRRSTFIFLFFSFLFQQPPVKVSRVDDLVVYVHTVGGFLLDPVRSAVEVSPLSSLSVFLSLAVDLNCPFSGR